MRFKMLRQRKPTNEFGNRRASQYPFPWSPLLLFRRTPQEIPRLEAIRQGAASSDIILHANEGWNAEIYADLEPHLLHLGVMLAEKPLPAENYEALLEMDRPLAVCADESCHDRTGLSKLTSKYDMVNIKLDKTSVCSERPFFCATKWSGLATGLWSAAK